LKNKDGLLERPSFRPLPKGFVLAKPKKQDQYEEEVIYKLEKEGNLIITRKRDGFKLFAVKANGAWTIYTDGINEVHCLDHVKKDLEKLKLPDQTILVGESVVDAFKDDIENFQLVQSIMQANPKNAVEKQKQFGFIRLMLFGIVFLKGECRITGSFEEQLKLIGKVLKGKRLKYVEELTVLKMSFDEAKKKVKKEKWEGLVLFAKNFSSTYRLDGRSPSRPKGCYKWKPLYEDDFIVRGFILKKDDSEKVKEVLLSQIDPKSSKEFDCGKFGLFAEATRKTLKDAKYPMVIQLEFEKRFKKTGKLRNARFMRFRLDKKPTDCVSGKSFSNPKFL